MEEVIGYSPTGWAVHGSTNSGSGVVGSADSGFGTNGYSKSSYGVFGRSGSSAGVVGDTVSRSPGVWGHNRGTGSGVVGTTSADDEAGVWGTNNNSRGYGVFGRSESGHGVLGWTDNGVGMYGVSYLSGDVVYGWSSKGTAVVSICPSSEGLAGDFRGRVEVFGDVVNTNGNKLFKIDHPLDPKNRYLLHNCVESSERKNVYDGVAWLGEDGSAWIDLPEWFEALNGDVRYQLTSVGGAAPDLHVAEEISENRFKVAGGQEGMKVCWQVTGSRKDPWAAANPVEVEQEKPQEDRGRYLQPDLYGAPEEQRVMRARMIEERLEPPQEPPQAPELPLGFAAPGYGSLEQENRRQIYELRRQIEELKRQL
jgi:hypothetical protein